MLASLLVISAGAALVVPPDTTTRPTFRHAAYVGLHSAEYGGANHYGSLSYEWLLSPRVSVRAGIGGVHRSEPVYITVFDPTTGYLSYDQTGRSRYNSLLLTSQVRYFLWPTRRPAAGLFVGAGLQLVAEEFARTRANGASSNIQVHVPLSTRIGYQLRKGRWLLSGSAGLDFTRRDEVPFNSQRPGKGGHEVHVTTGSDLQVGFLF